MERIGTWRGADGSVFDVPESQQGAFLADALERGVDLEPVHTFQDDAGGKYDVPESARDAFLTDAQAQGRVLEPVHTVKTVDGGVFDIPHGQREAFLNDYRTAPAMAADREEAAQRVRKAATGPGPGNLAGAIGVGSARGAGQGLAAIGVTAADFFVHGLPTQVWGTLNTLAPQGSLVGRVTRENLDAIREDAQAVGWTKGSLDDSWAGMPGRAVGGAAANLLTMPTKGLMLASLGTMLAGQGQETYTHALQQGVDDGKARRVALETTAAQGLPMALLAVIPGGEAFRGALLRLLRAIPAEEKQHLVLEAVKQAGISAGKGAAAFGGGAAAAAGIEQAEGTRPDARPWYEGLQMGLEAGLAMPLYETHGVVGRGTGGRRQDTGDRRQAGETSTTNGTAGREVGIGSPAEAQRRGGDASEAFQGEQPVTSQTAQPATASEPGGPGVLAGALEQATASANRFAGREQRPNAAERRASLEAGLTAPQILPERVDPNTAENLNRLTDYVMESMRVDRNQAARMVAKTSAQARTALLTRLETHGADPEVTLERQVRGTASGGEGVQQAVEEVSRGGAEAQRMAGAVAPEEAAARQALRLESPTAEEIDLEQERRAQQEEIQKRQEKGLEGTAGDVNQMNLAGIEGGEETLFNQGPDKIAGMGGTGTTAEQRLKARARAAVNEANTTPETKAAGRDWTAAVMEGRKRWFRGFRRLAMANTLDESARHFASILQSNLGWAMRTFAQADDALKVFRKHYDRTPVDLENWRPEKGKPLPYNLEVQRAIDGGDTAALGETDRKFAQTMRGLLDDAIEDIQAVAPQALKDQYENYFPRSWKPGPGMTEEQATGIANNILARRPFEGGKTFLKQRSIADWNEAIERGLVPLYDNPVDMALAKLGEMYKFVAARRTEAAARDAGLRKFRYIFSKPRDGWRVVDDPSNRVMAPPTVTVREAFDAQMRQAALDFAHQIGVPHERLTSLGPGRHHWWGYAQKGTGEIKTRFAGPEGVIWHEIGHQLEWRYNLADELVRNAVGVGARGEVTATASQKMRARLNEEMRALADSRNMGESKHDYVRSKDEKAANLVAAFVTAPDAMRRIAPTLYESFNRLIDLHPELKAIREIRPSVELGTGEKQLKLDGPILLGHWEMPEGAARVLENYLSRGFGGNKNFRDLRSISGLMNSAQLIGFFHGQMVTNDSISAGMNFAIHDLLTGRIARVPRDIAHVVSTPIEALIKGYRLGQEYLRPGTQDPQIQMIAKAFEESGMRSTGHDHQDFMREWTRTVRLFQQDPSFKHAWQALLKTPLAATQTVMAPVMKYLVPNMKRGIWAMQMEDWMRKHPDATPEEIRFATQRAANDAEDRLGQITYDNLHQNRMLKDALQIGLRAYGWQATKYRLGIGGAVDWVKAGNDLAHGRAPEVTYRMTYLPAMAITHAIIGGTLMYAMTGRKPEKLVDYLFPETGLVDAYGRPIRMAIADFMKDYVADFRSFPDPRKMTQEWTKKLAPFWLAAAEMYQDQDFFGTQIFSDRDIGEPYIKHLLQNLQEGATFLAGQAVPFSARGSQKIEEVGGKPWMKLGPYLGFVTAPRYATATPAETLSYEIMRGERSIAGRTMEEKRHSDLMRSLLEGMRTIRKDGYLSPDAQKKFDESKAALRSPYDIRAMMERLQVTPMQYQISSMSNPRNAMRVWDVANKDEKREILPFVARKVGNSTTLDPATKQRYLSILTNTLPGTK